MALNPTTPQYDWQALSQLDKDNIKHDRMRIETMLIADGVKSIPDGTGNFLCPYHDDKNPSAEIRELPSGYYFICYACNLHLDYFALVKHRENIPLSEAFKQASMTLDDTVSYLNGSGPSTGPPNAQQNGSIHALLNNFVKYRPNTSVVAIHHYTDEFSTVRIQTPQGKKVLPVSLTGSGWDFKALPGKTPLYNLERVTNTQNILVVEGEKCVDKFTNLGIEGWAATTSSGGSKAVYKTEWEPLHGKNVYIWRDYDKPGEMYLNNVIGKLKGRAAEIRIVNVEHLAEGMHLGTGADIADFIDTIGMVTARQAVLDVLADTEVWSPILVSVQFCKDVKSGRYQLIQFPNIPEISTLTQAGLPGKMTVISGPPGSAKSFLVMEMGWMLTEANVKTATMFLEDGELDYQKRCIAQMSGRVEYTRDDWVKNNYDEAEFILNSVSDRINNYFDHVTCMQSKIISPDDVLKWLTKRAQDGYRVMIIDPVTAMALSTKQWMTDQNFVMTALNIITECGASLVLTTHPKSKSAEMAGGQSWSRFSHVNLTLSHAETNTRLSKVVKAGDEHVVEHRREILLSKVRSAPGMWSKFAVDIDPTSLRFIEHGVITGKATVQNTPVNTEDRQF